jgi:hypothetical protein
VSAQWVSPDMRRLASITSITGRTA